MKTIDGVVTTPAGRYELLDFGRGRRLERFGQCVLDRPAPNADNSRAQQSWHADWTYSGARIGGGKWLPSANDLPDEWIVQVDDQPMHCRLGDSGRIGIYPEQIACWRWIRKRLAGARSARVLNCFAGSGGATVAAVRADAAVTHVDAQRAAIAAARKNAGANAARWIPEDVTTFLRRDVRRGTQYDLVVLDPPSFGRGGRRDWRLTRDLPEVLKFVGDLLSSNAVGVWVSAHTQGLAAVALTELLHDCLARGDVSALSLGVRAPDGRTLSGGVAACWPAK